MTVMRKHRTTSRQALIGLEAVTGALACAGGALLIARPDGALLRADPAVLTGTPFGSWRVPGVLLLSLVGLGFLLTAAAEHRRLRFARRLSACAGAGLVAFELAELGWIGPHPLEAVFAAVGVVVVVLA